MAEIPMDYVKGHGVRIPAVGLGTWQLTGRNCARLVEQAIRLGYRHIDTAEMYENEREVGEGIRNSGVRRSEIFLTTKIWPTHFAPLEFERATKECLARLRVSEVDLLLLHWPSRRLPLAETVEALCKVKRAGFARYIGVSNFMPELLTQAIALSTEPLVCNQIEVHPFLDQSAAVDATENAGMAVVAYSPIAKGGVQKDETIVSIARAHGKSPAQVSLRFLTQRGIGVIPRSSRVERLSENIEIFDFRLSDDEMAAIGKLARADGSVLKP